ncbi:hypothetical protein [Xenorhabdus sp. PB30.3]|uniref:hypothetical protein n=1 Tax=Xenorhabdus sp. PB30.3 TaxID=2788941 RepID=UPI001E2EF69E|nr:hypothetical protein [Xenorhabdus sp. PB30.3]MCC8380467.1 hypothetical protein [Xenorhabdus sp. PB30.3]
MANKDKRFRQPIRKHSVPEKDIDSFIDGKTHTDNLEDTNEQVWYETLESSDKTKASEKPVHINVNEYYREWGTKLAELDSQYANRKHLYQVLIFEGMNKLIEKTLKEQKKK